MTITADTAAQLDALALTIFNLNIVPNDPSKAGLGAHFDPTRYTGIKGQDASIDAQYYNLIAPAMLAIDGRTMAPGFMYTMNQSNSLQGRPRHWFYEGLNEFEQGGLNVLPPVSVAFRYSPPSGGAGLSGDWGSYGFTLASAHCAAFCKLWAQIIRMWIGGTYPYAVSLPTPST